MRDIIMSMCDKITTKSNKNKVKKFSKDHNLDMESVCNILINKRIPVEKMTIELLDQFGVKHYPPPPTQAEIDQARKERRKQQQKEYRERKKAEEQEEQEMQEQEFLSFQHHFAKEIQESIDNEMEQAKYLMTDEEFEKEYHKKKTD